MKTNVLLCSISMLFVLVIFPLSGKSQKWIADTITISFPGNITCDFDVENAIDHRKVDDNFISVYEQKKWLVFPVDQIVKTQLPLTYNLRNAFSNDTVVGGGYVIDIHEFYIKNLTSSGKRNLTLFSTLELSKKYLTDTTLIGTLYYEQAFRQKKKDSITLGYKSLLEQWSEKFVNDIIAIELEQDLKFENSLYHFRRNKPAVKKNLYTEVDFFAGINFWGIDGSIWFSKTEGNRIFNRSAGIMRYVNHPTFQAIAFGKNLRLWNYRINEKWLFTHKMAFMMGFNNWKDMATADHKMEEILYFNLSFTQRINYNPFDDKGLVFGIGLIEDAHYIIYHKPKLKIGLSFNCAYKF